MAVTLVNLSGYAHGVASDETGINVESFSVSSKPEFKNFAKNRQGEKIGFAVAEAESEITIEGEVTGSSGLMALVFTTAATVANALGPFAPSAGGVYLDSADVVMNREKLKMVSIKLSKNKGIA